MRTRKTYYHIQKLVDEKPEWFSGDEYFIDPNKFNYFQKGILLGLGDYRENSKGEPIGLIKHMGELLNGDFNHSNNIDLFHPCNDLTKSLRQYIKWIQEEIFEKVRLANYSKLSSRKSCLWLCSFDQLKNWIDIIGNTKSRFPQPDIKILSLSVDGTFHEADALLIDTDTHKIEEFESAANSYWDGIKESDNEIEVLFHGEVKVLNEFKTINEINNNT